MKLSDVLRADTSQKFLRLHLAGWIAYALLATAAKSVIKFPLYVSILETLFYFFMATAFYAVISSLRHRNPIAKSIMQNLHAMLMACTLVGALAGLLWTPLMVSQYLPDILQANPGLTAIPLKKLLAQYYFYRINDTAYLFCIWGAMWQSSTVTAANTTAYTTPLKNPSIRFALGFVIIAFIINYLILAPEPSLLNFATGAICRTILVTGLLLWTVKTIPATGPQKQQSNLLQAYTAVIIIMMTISMPAVILLDYVQTEWLQYLQPGATVIGQFHLNTIKLNDLIKKEAGIGRQFFHHITLLSFVWLHHYYRHPTTASTTRLVAIPRTTAFWSGNVAAWLLMAMISMLVDYWRLTDITLLEALYTIIKLVMIGGFLSLVARFLILSHDWAISQPYQLIPRLTAIAVMMGISLVFLDTFTECTLQANYFGQVEYTGMFSGRASTTMIQSTYAKAALYILWFFLWSFVYSFYIANQHKMSLTVDALRLQTETAESKLSLLSSQLDPHFIFNTLTGIRYLVHQDPDLARDSLLRLSDLLRKNLTKNHRNKITLRDEVALVRDYLDLYKMQLEDRLAWSEDIPPASLNCLLPPMTIQMLVENAIKHGISQSTEGGQIHLWINADKGQLQITLENTIAKMPNPSTVESGIGLQNIKQRLHIMYGDNASFDIKISPEIATATIWLPAELRFEPANHEV